MNKSTEKVLMFHSHHEDGIDTAYTCDKELAILLKKIADEATGEGFDADDIDTLIIRLAELEVITKEDTKLPKIIVVKTWEG
jgi:hypothetical protein